MTIKTDDEELIEIGGKGLHLRLLQRGGFPIPDTYDESDIGRLPNSRLYVVRSSAAGEDGHTKTAAGRYLTKKGISRGDIGNAVLEVRSHYPDGGVVIQPDLTSLMEYSGVAYSNLNGDCIISMGRNNFVQHIVEGVSPETEIAFSNGKYSIQGDPLDPTITKKIHGSVQRVESYFGIPMDIEFAVIGGEITLLQARPLPNPTMPAIRCHEVKRLRHELRKTKGLGLEEVVLGVGNYREILGNSKVTDLSATTFNYIFSGDGEDILGAVQLGRNELGYDIGTEIFPWVVMLGGKLYYNFAGDAMQFRPRGITEESLMSIVNGVYLPIVRGNPDLLNYPELRLYIQFPEQAERVGLDPNPYAELAEKNRSALREIAIPRDAPVKIKAERYDSIEDCVNCINGQIDRIRTGSAKEYVKAARLAFFALEDIRSYLENAKKENPEHYKEIVDIFGDHSPEQLRDEIVYDESIGSFEVPESEEYNYLGSFEMTLPRGYPPKRNFKRGRDIPEERLSDIVKVARHVLEYREKVKFELFRDYDCLKQLYDQLSGLSGFGDDIYYLRHSELDLVIHEPRLALYRTELRKQIKNIDIFGDPLFESDLEGNVRRMYDKKPQLVFGSLAGERMSVYVGREGYIVDSVDQTIGVPEETKVVFVPDNVRPGSHLFTVLSDYGLPVIGMPQDELEKIRERNIEISLKDNYVNIEVLQ